ncbi:MAG: DUF4747 family protein [Holophagales bacterium]|jgi:hypothetical protein|nr:DUF4747 family protein [Holophagales bacterium]
MAKQKTLKTAALNITTEPPHSPENYIRLIKYLAEKGGALSGKLSHSDRLMLRRAVELPGAKFQGDFARYTLIDPNVPWLDIDKREPIVNDDGEPIPQVKEGRGANLKIACFMFYADSHLFVFDCRNISPKLFKEGLDKILKHKEALEEFGPISLTVLPTKDALETLLNLPDKTKIELEFTLPNGDVPDEAERVRRRYENMGASRVGMKVTSQSGRMLEPDEDLKTTMGIASTDGYVRVTHKAAKGKTRKRSTEEMPRIETAAIDDEYWDTLDSLGGKFIRKGEGTRGRKK